MSGKNRPPYPELNSIARRMILKHECLFQLDQLEKAGKGIETYKTDTIRCKVEQILDGRNILDFEKLHANLRACRRKLQSVGSEKFAKTDATGMIVDSLNEVSLIVNLSHDVKVTRSNIRKNFASAEENQKSNHIRLTRGFQLEEIQDEQRLLEFFEVTRQVTMEIPDEVIRHFKTGKAQLHGFLTPAGEILALIGVHPKSRRICRFDLNVRDHRTKEDHSQRAPRGIFAKRCFTPHSTFHRWGGYRHSLRLVSDSEILPVSSSGDFDSLLMQEDLIEMLSLLDATADHIDEFVALGAFSRFRNGIPDVEAVELIDGRELWIWRFSDELITAVDLNRETRNFLRWSRYIPTGQSWECPDLVSMSQNQLFDIMLDNPQVYEMLRRH